MNASHLCASPNHLSAVTVPANMHSVMPTKNSTLSSHPKNPMTTTLQHRNGNMPVGGPHTSQTTSANASAASQVVVTRRAEQPHGRRHPAPLPYPDRQIPSQPGWLRMPPRPTIRINSTDVGIVISWTMDELNADHAAVVSYQIWAYQETAALPSTDTWRLVGDVNALTLPMAVTLTQFQEGQRYHFAVRALDDHRRLGVFSIPRTWT